MQFRYGTYFWEANAVECASDVETIRNAAGVPLTQRKTFRLTGELLAEGQAAVSNLMRGLENALKIPYQDLVLIQDDGSESATILKNDGSLTGVICTQGPGFPESKGGEYVNQRTFTATFEAEYPLDGSENMVVSFTETVRFFGGGAVRTAEPAVEGPAIEFVIWQRTPFEAVQSGSSVGYRQLPIVPPAIWPTKLRALPVVTITSPERHGKGLQNYKVDWEYQFVSAVPLPGGLPHLPP